MLIWVSYLSSYFCFCHEVFSKRKFWIGLWSGVWIALQKYCWSDPRIALQKLYWIGVWIAFQKFWSVQCTAVNGHSCTTAPPGGKRRKKRNNNNGNGVLRSGYTFVAAELQIQCWSPSSANKAALQGWKLLTNNPLLEIQTYFIQ